MENCDSEQVPKPNLVGETDIEQPHLEGQPHLGSPQQATKIVIPQSQLENQSEENKPKLVSPKDRAQLLLKILNICNYIAQVLDGSTHGDDGVAYSQNQAMDLANALLQGVVQLEKSQKAQQRQVVQKLFDKVNIDLIKNQQLYYYGMLDKLNQNHQQISQNIKSRVYHKIANIKKEKEIKEQKQKNYGINCIKSNEYKKLSEEELNETVKYQVISDHVRKMGEKMGFKLESIKKQSDAVLKVLQQVMTEKQCKYIDELKYDLDNQIEVIQMARISKEACKYYDNGVFILLNYFVQSCTKLQNRKVPPQQIEDKLTNIIKFIASKHPPGEGLPEQNKNLLTNISRIMQKCKSFSHKQQPLQSENKQDQVQRIILKYAQTAEQCKDLFQQLVKSTCIQKAVLFKIGLKLYPKNQNNKAMIRIKQKMLFPKKKDQNKDKSEDKSHKKHLIGTGTIEQILNNQKTNYGKKIDQNLQKKKAILFQISDMLRGKCVFLQVSDISDTVRKIQEFVEKNTSKFTIIKIESRFGNKPPISDVTLKIVISDRIVAELQLTIQNNAATYNFAHKIYQLDRSEIFSKIAIVHNYFQEYKNDFSQLACKALKLQQSKSLNPQAISSIRRYFKLQSNIDKTFRQILPQALSSQKIASFPIITNTIDPLVQDLMLGIFTIETGLWHKKVGKIINRALKKQELPNIQKSVLTSCFMDKFYLPKESEYMQQLGFTDKQLQKKIFMEEFIKEYFQIQHIFKYTLQNQKVFHRAKQLKEIKFTTGSDKKYPIQLKQSQFVVNLITGNSCIQNINRLRQMLDFYFVTREEKEDTIYPKFTSYYKWIEAELQNNDKLDKEGLISSQIAILKAQQYLEKLSQEKTQNFGYRQLDKVQQLFEKLQLKKVEKLQPLFAQKKQKQAHQLLQKLQHRKFYKIQQLFRKLKLERVQWLFNLGQLKKVQQQIKYSQLKKLLSDINYRLRNKAQQLFKNPQLQKVQQLLQDGKLQQAQQKIDYRQLKQASLFLDTAKSIFSNKERHQKVMNCEILLMECKIKQEKLALNNAINQHKAVIKRAVTLGLQLKGSLYADALWRISEYFWCQIQETNTVEKKSLLEQFTKMAIEQMSRSKGKQFIYALEDKWSQFKDNGLEQCKIFENERVSYAKLYNLGLNSCSYLTIAKWNNLKKLNLTSNKIGAIGCKDLRKGKWENLTQLNLSSNDIGDKGCEHIRNPQSKWSKLAQLDLSYNQIGAEGCSNLSKAEWKHLTHLNLGFNQIDAEGCNNLSKAEWKHLTQLDLRRNKIGADGCNYLSSAKWEHLTQLNLRSNDIGAEGCNNLSKAEWKHLTQLDLHINNIKSGGCQYLSKAEWANLAHLNLQFNDIGANGCQYLSSAKWTNNITHLYLIGNNFGDLGCKFLSEGGWKNLTTLDIMRNLIYDAGCQFLSNAEWYNLTQINLRQNKIQAKGCLQLTKANWDNLTFFDICENEIYTVGKNEINKVEKQEINKLKIKQLQVLVKKKWPKLTWMRVD